MTPKFESLPEAAPMLFRFVYIGNSYYELCELKRKIEALWPEFGEGKEAP